MCAGIIRSPFFTDVKNSLTEQRKMVADGQLATDLNTGDVPNYSFIVPDLAHDGHNPDTTSIALSNADNYLAGLLPPLLNSSYFQPGGDGVLIVTFDESDLTGDDTCGTVPETNKCGGHIFLTIIGPQGNPSFQSNIHHSQRDVLKTTCDLMGLSACPGDSAQGIGMTEFFTSGNPGGCAPPSSPGVNFCTPGAGDSVLSPMQFTGAGTGASGSTANRMELWIDGTKVNDYPGNQIDAKVAVALGNHSATMIEVDSNGNYIKSSPVAFNVIGGCSAPNSPGVNVCSPTMGQVGSPVQFTAAGTGASGRVSPMELWIDGGKINNYPGNQFNTSLNLQPGSIVRLGSR